MTPARLHAVLGGADRSLGATLTRAALAALEPGYRVIVAARNAAFDHRLRQAHALARPTISVGNLTTGGTGKTPMVVELVRRLQAMGVRPAVLMRGYMPGGRKGQGPGAGGHDTGANVVHSHGSDERVVLLRELAPIEVPEEPWCRTTPPQPPNWVVPVVCHPRRVEAARLALNEQPEIDVFVLDDGFQHRQARRDLDLVLIDATCPFGFGHMLPRGLLREPVSGLRRADGVIVTRSDALTPKDLAALDADLQAIAGQPPLAHALHAWTGLRGGERSEPDGANAVHGLERLGQQPVAGVCAIGNPEAFFHSLRAHAAEVVLTRAFGDHHRFTAREVRAVAEQAIAAGARCLVMTEKDWVKWQSVAAQAPGPHLPVLRPVLQMRLTEGGESLDNLLKQMLTRRKEKVE